MIQQRTKIVCTLGPASDKPETIRRMIRAGADIFRLNASHGTEANHTLRIYRVRKASRALQQPVGILLDLPGPKLRLGKITDEKVFLRKGETVRLGNPGDFNPGVLPLRNPEIIKDLRPRHEVYLADGTVTLVVEKVETDGVRCLVQVGGVVRSGSGINLPDTELSGAVPTEADRKWIRFGRAHHIDSLAVSFVQKPGEIETVRKLAGIGKSSPRIMAKIEKRGALRNLDDIVKAADAVMVARGDLGVETPLAGVPLAQKRIIAAANCYWRPVVTATQMLESMVENPSPTRAEVSDVANAILDGTDAVMLSAESAIGRYPVESTAALGRIAYATEGNFPYAVAHQKSATQNWASSLEAISFSAARLASDCQAKAILVAPHAETTAASVSRFRPEARVIQLCYQWEDACRQTLSWGVDPLVIPKSRIQTIRFLKNKLRKVYAAGPGSRVILIQSAQGLFGAGSDILRIVRI